MREHGEDKSPAARMTLRCGVGMGGSATPCLFAMEDRYWDIKGVCGTDPAKSPAARMTPRCGVGMGGSAVQCSPAVIGAARRSHGAGPG